MKDVDYLIESFLKVILDNVCVIEYDELNESVMREVICFGFLLF